MKNKLYFFDYVNFVLLGLVCVVTFYPFLNVFAISFSTYEQYLMNPMSVWPETWVTAAYRDLIARSSLWSSYGNTIFVVIDLPLSSV